MDDKDIKMNIKVSGRDIYKAVKNYIQNDPDLKNQITNMFTNMETNGQIKELIERETLIQLRGYYLKPIVTEAIKEIINKDIKDQIKKEIKTSIDKTMAELVFVMPTKKE